MLSDIQAAAARLRPYLTPTPLESAPGLGEGVWLKLENANQTHSFKCRGALNALLAMSAFDRERGVVAASSGNHAQGLAYAAGLLGVQAQIVMPTHTPRRKVEGALRWGAEVLLYGESYDEAEAQARRLERTRGLTFVSPYNDPGVIAGGGTVGLEIIEALPNVARVIVPGGGCGLISGIGLALKAHHPAAHIVGVCAQAAPALYNWLHGAHLPQQYPTLAEALSGEIEAGSITFELTKQVVDRCVLVDEAQTAAAMRWLAFEAGWIVEGGGAVGVAALQTGAEPAGPAPTVVVISGGNIDRESLLAILNA